MSIMKGLKGLSFGIVALFIFMSCQNSNKESFDSTYIHSVHFWLKNPESKEDRKAFETSLDKFLKNSEFAMTNYVGTPPKATREVVDDSFTYHLLVTFPSVEAQESYQAEAAHLLFIEEASSLWDKVIVYDSKTIK